MADDGQEKTEQPTQRRFEKAAEDGQVAQSADFSSGILILAGTLFFFIAGAWFYSNLTEKLRFGLGHNQLDTGSFAELDVKIRDMINATFWEVMLMIGPLVIVTFGLAILNGAIISGVNITWKPLTPNFEKLDPIKGFKKIFSSRAGVRGLLAVAKVSALAIIVYWLIMNAMGRLTASCGLPFELIVGTGWQLTLQIALAIAAAMVFVGVADLAFQKWKHTEDLKMTRKELRDEYKESDGDPYLKARMKKLQREISSRTMMNDVKNADVVIRNPTHFAVALRFDRLKDNAPIVLAKGVDAVALKIIEIAEESKVPVIERRPVARALYAIAEVGDEIPLELYQAVAEILAYVARSRSIIRR